MKAPLAGIRVIDVSQYAAGPICALLLGDHGADVLKIEPIGGDPFRPARTADIGGTNPGFLALNRNKRSLAVDLRTPEGQSIVRRLARDADVFVENFRSGVAERLNVGYDRLRRTNRRLVYCSISGFGSAGPYRDRPAVDVIAQAMAGLMDQTGEADGEPSLVGTPLADYLGGIFGALGVVMALLGRGPSGRGEHVEVSLVDGLLFVLGVRFGEVFATGRNPPRRGSGHSQTAPGGVFHARDGRFTVAVMSASAWDDFCRVIGADELRDDARFATNVDRVKNRGELIRRLDGLFGTKDRAHWLELIGSRGIPCGPVNTLLDVLNDPALGGILTSTSYAGVSQVRTVGSPLKIGRRAGAAHRPPPTVGEHTRTVLREAGFSDAQLRRWAAAGIIASGPAPDRRATVDSHATMR